MERITAPKDYGWEDDYQNIAADMILVFGCFLK